tara:strand:- start:29 stop:1393 length:1365 start_codon:yes stop_codon:yes gene_type:complete
MAIALGADLFDSAAYALFARDDRLLSPEGTVKLEGLTEWPVSSAALFGRTTEEVREMDKDERSTLLAHHNLEVTQTELARCREAVREGRIWQLAERRSHANPQLREAFLWVLDQLEEMPDEPSGETALQMLASTNPVRMGREDLSEDVGSRPHILHLHALLSMRWRVPGSWWDGSEGKPERVVIIDSVPPPWRMSALGAAVEALLENPRSLVMIPTPLGPIPFSMEDVSPWCHLECSDETWLEVFDDEEIWEGLEELGLEDMPLVRASPVEIPDGKKSSEIRQWLDRCSIVDKLSVLCAVPPIEACKLTGEMEVRRSNTDRIVNVFDNQQHILSPRLNDGGISLALEGASRLNSNPNPPALFGEPLSDPDNDHPGIPRVRLLEDAIPFVGKGRNVMHGYIRGADPHLIPGQPCLVVDDAGNLVAHGSAITTPREMSQLSKGVAVRVREGALRGD